MTLVQHVGQHVGLQPRWKRVSESYSASRTAPGLGPTFTKDFQALGEGGFHVDTRLSDDSTVWHCMALYGTVALCSTMNLP